MQTKSTRINIYFFNIIIFSVLYLFAQSVFNPSALIQSNIDLDKTPINNALVLVDTDGDLIDDSIDLDDDNDGILDIDETSVSVTSTFSYTGSNQTFTVPANIYTIEIDAWGAGGGDKLTEDSSDPGTSGSGTGPVFDEGGGGGYGGVRLTVTPGDVITVSIGEGGASGDLTSQTNGGGAGGNAPGFIGCSGGGYTSISVNGTLTMVVGGGGGAPGGIAHASSIGGAGGGGGTSYTDGSGDTYQNGQTAISTTVSGGGIDSSTANDEGGGYGANSTAGGAGGDDPDVTNNTPLNTSEIVGNAGSSLAGGAGATTTEASCGGGGGGGGGFFGGGGGACQVNSLNALPQDRAGGGGSSFINTSDTKIYNAQLIGGSGSSVANATDSDYVSGIGIGGINGSSGGNGYVTIKYYPAVDTDSDGKYDHVDLDSDGDGCYDRIEAGVTGYTTNGSLTDSLIASTATVGANGLDNSVETAVDNGTINYTIIQTNSGTNDFQDAFVRAPDCQVCNFPGSVASNFMWYKANANVTGTTSVSAWGDQSGNGLNLSQSTSGNQPALSEGAINFNPAISFDGSSDFFSAPISLNYSLFPDLTIIAVYQPDIDNAGGVWGEDDGGWDRFLLDGNSTTLNNIVSDGVGGNTGISNLFTANQTSLTTVLYDQGVSSGSSVFVNGTSQSTFTANHSATSANLQIGALGSGNYFFDGEIAEVILYNRLLGTTHRQKVESYLAIKYGVMIPGDYLNGDGSIIWNATTNSTYHNDVAGIGREDCSVLDQRQSKNSNGTAIVELYNGDVSAAFPLTNTANTNSFSADKSFLIWGNNAAGLSTVSTNVYSGTTENRVPQIWKVAESGTVGTTTIRILKSSLPNTALVNYHLYVNNNNDTAFPNDATTQKISLIDRGTYYYGTVDFTNGNIFSFGGPSLDSDNDTVSNIDDVDDDNDGIRDIDECAAIYRFNVGGSAYTDARGRIWSVESGVSGGTSASVSGATNLNTGNLPGTNTDATVYNTLRVPGYAGTFNYTLPITNGDYLIVFHWADCESNGHLRMINIDIEGSSVLTNYSPQNEFGICVAGTRSFTTTVSDGNLNIVFSGTGYPILYALEVFNSTCDTDSDGVVDYLDLDSDGNGCYDKVEAGVTGYTTNGSITDSLAATTFAEVGSNGLDNDIENDDTQAATTSASYTIIQTNSGTNDFQDAAVQATDCPCTGLDTDRDGICDSVDIDDDNDGIIDVEEGYCFYTLVNASFESPSIGACDSYSIIDESTVPGWLHTDDGGSQVNCATNNGGTDNELELWDSGYQSVIADDGNQFAELNAYSGGVLYQPITLPVQGTYILDWTVAHRGRNGIDSMRIGILEGGIFLASDTVGTNNVTFVTYSGRLQFTAATTTIWLGFESTHTASGFASIGNFIDDVTACIHLDLDRDNIADYLDLDSDNDGIPNIIEAGGIDTDGNGTVDYSNGHPLSMVDLDNDGLADLYDETDNGGSTPGWVAGNAINSPDTDGDMASNAQDLDADNDGIPDLIEVGGVDSNGDGMIDISTDADNDGFADIFDPDDDGIIGVDSGEGNQPLVKTNGAGSMIHGETGISLDHDGDGLFNQMDLDSDNDGISDLIEAGGIDMNGDGKVDTTTDADGDSFADIYDTDDDGISGVEDTNDALLQTGGTDTDGDGKADDTAITYIDGESRSLDADGDGIVNFLDVDTDNDGIPDLVEAGGIDTNGNGRVDVATDSNSDGLADIYATSALVRTGGTDTDGDGKADDTAITFIDGGSNSVDSDGDAYADHLDLDSDNDGIPDIIEARGTDPDNNGRVDTATLPWDADGDGLADIYDEAASDGPKGSGTNGTALIETSADTNSDGKVNNTETMVSGGTASIDGDGDTYPNHLDLDSDNDGITDVVENGGGNTTVDHSTGTLDGIVGDNASVTDTNNDGWHDSSTSVALDSDSDGVVDYLDLDTDNDGIPDYLEGVCSTCPTFASPSGNDTDGDGLLDIYESLTSANANSGTNSGVSPNEDDNDGTSPADYLDTDSDNDGIYDWSEGFDTDGDGVAYDDMILLAATYETNNGNPDNYTTTNTDSDNLPDWMDNQISVNGYIQANRPPFLDHSTAFWFDVNNNGLADIFDIAANGSLSPTPDVDGINDNDWRDSNTFAILPVELISFFGEEEDCSVILKWESANEKNFKHYVIERSIDGELFSEVATIPGEGGATNQVYKYQDQYFNSEIYYRLMMVNADGAFQYSKIILVEMECNILGDVTVFPNPLGNQHTTLNINVELIKPQTMQICIVDILGQKLQELKTEFKIGQNQIQLDVSELPSGTYFLRFMSEGKMIEDFKFIKAGK